MKPTVLVVHEDEAFGRELEHRLHLKPYKMVVVHTAREGLAYLRSHKIAILVCDDKPRGMSGLAVLAVAQQVAPDCSRVLLIKHTQMATAAHAIRQAHLFRFLLKPCSVEDVNNTVLDALKARRDHRAHDAKEERRNEDHVEHVLNDELDEAFGTCRVVYQPILSTKPLGANSSASGASTYGYEALLRVDHAGMPTPESLVDAASEARRETELDRLVRDMVASDIDSAKGLDPDASVFVNVSTQSLEDPELLRGREMLHRFSKRVVLEVSESTPLTVLEDLHKTTKALWAHGYRLCVDDLANGPTGLHVLGRLRPNVVRINASLLRGIYQTRAHAKAVISVVRLCEQLGCVPLADRVETQKELDYFMELGVTLFQGPFIAHPSAGFTPLGAAGCRSSYRLAQV